MSRESQYELFAWKCKIMLDVFIDNSRSCEIEYAEGRDEGLRAVWHLAFETVIRLV